MGTRACIAIPDGDGWKGRYHHWDGYPSGLGATLITAKDKYFGGDLDAMIKYLITDELVGWSTINEADLTQPPQWDDTRVTQRLGHGPQSYSARGEKSDHEDGNWIRSTDEDVAGAEWVYILMPQGVMVLEGDWGAFGSGGGNFRDPKIVPWNDLAGMLAVEEGPEEA